VDQLLDVAISRLGTRTPGLFQFGADYYLVADIGTDGTTFDDNEDMAVRLVNFSIVGSTSSSGEFVDFS
jgi:hypothetical protein